MNGCLLDQRFLHWLFVFVFFSFRLCVFVSMDEWLVCWMIGLFIDYCFFFFVVDYCCFSWVNGFVAGPLAVSIDYCCLADYLVFFHGWMVLLLDELFFSLSIRFLFFCQMIGCFHGCLVGCWINVFFFSLTLVFFCRVLCFVFHEWMVLFAVSLVFFIDSCFFLVFYRLCVFSWMDVFFVAGSVVFSLIVQVCC